MKAAAITQTQLAGSEVSVSPQTPMTVTLSVEVPIEKAARLIAFLKESLLMAETTVPKMAVGPASVIRETNAATTQSPAPSPSASGISRKPANIPDAAQNSRTATVAPMTDKQQRMIESIMAQKALDPSIMESIMLHQFGHNRQNQMNKFEASALIKQLLAL